LCGTAYIERAGGTIAARGILAIRSRFTIFFSQQIQPLLR